MKWKLDIYKWVFILYSVYIYVYVCVCLSFKILLKTIIVYSGKKKFIPCWFCMFAFWQINYQSIILMVGLFEQWETE